MAKKNNTADIGFEKEIWKAADLLRVKYKTFKFII